MTASGTTLPRAVDDLDAAWIAAALGEPDAPAPVTSVEIVEVVHATSTKVRLLVHRSDRSEPQALCAKANWEDHADFTLAAGIWATEAHFYAELRSAIPVPAPVAHFAAADATSGQGVIVLDDLVASGARFGVNVEPMTIDQAAAALDGLAVLHAEWWGAVDTGPPASVPRSMEQGTIDAEMVPFHGGPDGIEPLFLGGDRGGLLPSAVADNGRFCAALERLRIHDLSVDVPRCLIHGDTHLGNTYRLAGDDEVRWLDWQLTRRGQAVREVSYFLGNALTIDDRRAGERDLLRHHLDHLRALGAQTPAFEDAWDEYRRWPVWGLVCWVVTQDGWQDRVNIHETVRRFATAVDDLDSYRLLGV